MTGRPFKQSKQGSLNYVYLVSPGSVLLGGVLVPPDGGVQLLRLRLQALHLLPDRVHLSTKYQSFVFRTALLVKNRWLNKEADLQS
ncbi:MAG: hypothetical protein ACK56I_12625, partial [bacterium]